jgi:hypothetical protein
MNIAGNSLKSRPRVHLIGDAGHRDFVNAVPLLRNSASVDTDGSHSPELIVVAQSRPGEIGQARIEACRRRWPLAGIVAMLGSWCEGEARTGRPWPGVLRLYWYEFPSWWRRQIALWQAGRCPDWSRHQMNDVAFEFIDKRQLAMSHASNGVVVLSTSHYDSADALSDVLTRAGYATVCQPQCSASMIRGAVAGIWEGGQFNDREAAMLGTFCRRLAPVATPVVALLDFPRRDRVEPALNAGAAAVLGKPWRKADLLDSLQYVIATRQLSRAA